MDVLVAGVAEQRVPPEIAVEPVVAGPAVHLVAEPLVLGLELGRRRPGDAQPGEGVEEVDAVTAPRTLPDGPDVRPRRVEGDGRRPVREEDLLAGRYLLLRKGRRTYHLVRFGDR